MDEVNLSADPPPSSTKDRINVLVTTAWYNNANRRCLTAEFVKSIIVGRGQHFSLTSNSINNRQRSHVQERFQYSIIRCDCNRKNATVQTG